MSRGCSPTTYLSHDFAHGSGYSHVIGEYDENGTRQARYTQGPGVDEPLSVRRTGATYAYHRDAIGSVTLITDPNEAVARSYRYDAFGQITSGSGSLANPFTFTGREKDPYADLYHYRSRVYDPGVGRFLSKDPSGMADGPNLYAYAGNNPVGRRDPSGMRFAENDPFEPPGGGGGGGGGGNGPTCPPGKSGRGNAQGHCGGGDALPKSAGRDCLVEWTVFAIGLALGVLGVGVAASKARTFAIMVLRSFDAGSSLAISITNLMRNGLSLGSVGDILNIAWIVVQQFVLPVLGWLDALSFIAQAAGRLTPFTAAIAFGIMLTSAFLGYYALRNMGC